MDTTWKQRLAAIPAFAPLLRLIRWWRHFRDGLRLRLLADLGYFPSHRVRNFFYRRAGLTLPASSNIHRGAEFYSIEQITIGDHCIIGHNCFLDGRETIAIGDNVNMGSHVTIYTREHAVDSPTFAETGEPVRIEDYAWISGHAIVLPGVTVGEGAVVAAGSVVVKDVAPYTLVGGNPARYIRDRERGLTYQLGYRRRFF